MLEDARVRFLTYDPGVFREKNGVISENEQIYTDFLGETAKISLETGQIIFSGRRADFRESLCLYDWLCDGRREARAAGEFAPVSSLPGVLVQGGGLTMEHQGFAEKIDAEPETFTCSCRKLGGWPVSMGELSFEIPLFSDLTMVIKFYHGDDEFPPSCVLLWDRNILQYIRYETVYYLAGCLILRLETEMAG